MDVHHLVEGAAHVAEAVAAVAVGRSQRELLVAKQDMVIHQKWASFSFTIIPLKILTLNFYVFKNNIRLYVIMTGDRWSLAAAATSNVRPTSARLLNSLFYHIIFR